ncbi:unnamed protein product [Mucor hiemalis]
MTTLNKPDHKIDSDVDTAITRSFNKPNLVENDADNLCYAESSVLSTTKVRSKHFICFNKQFSKKLIYFLIGAAVVALIVIIVVVVKVTKAQNDGFTQVQSTDDRNTVNNTSPTVSAASKTESIIQATSSVEPTTQIAGKMIQTYYTHDSQSLNCNTVMTMRAIVGNESDRNVTAEACLTVGVGRYAYKVSSTGLLYVWNGPCFKQGNVQAITLNNTFINVTDYRLPATSIFSVSC